MYGTGLPYALWYRFGLIKALLVCFRSPVRSTYSDKLVRHTRPQQKTARLMLAIKYRGQDIPQTAQMLVVVRTAREPVMVPGQHIVLSMMCADSFGLKAARCKAVSDGGRI